MPGCGPRLVEVVTDRAQEAAFHARVRAEMARILPGLPGRIRPSGARPPSATGARRLTFHPS